MKWMTFLILSQSDLICASVRKAIVQKRRMTKIFLFFLLKAQVFVILLVLLFLIVVWMHVFLFSITLSLLCYILQPRCCSLTVYEVSLKVLHKAFEALSLIISCRPFSFQMVTRTKKIFVGGLSANTVVEDVKQYFEQFGKVRLVFSYHRAWCCHNSPHFNASQFPLNVGLTPV